MLQTQEELLFVCVGCFTMFWYQRHRCVAHIATMAMWKNLETIRKQVQDGVRQVQDGVKEFQQVAIDGVRDLKVR